MSTDAWLTIHLTRDGRVLFEGRACSLRDVYELLIEASGEREEPPAWLPLPRTRVAFGLLMCIDGDAPYLQVAWLRSIVRWAAYQVGRRFDIHLGVVTDGRRAVLAAPIVSGFWHQGFETSASSSEENLPIIRRRLGVTTDDIRAARVALADEYPYRPLGMLDVPSTAPFAEVVAAIDRFHDAGVDFVELSDETPHPWLRRQERLPRPRVSHLVDGLAPYRDVSHLDLPLAGAATPRGDANRLIVDVTARGRVIYRGKRVNLNELGAILHRAKETLEFRRRAKGESSLDDEGYSTLPVLVRADGAAPWESVRLVLAIMVEQKTRRFHIGAMAQADLSYPAGAAARFGVRRVDRLPRPVGVAEDEISVPMPTAPIDGLELAVDGDGYTVGGRTTTDLHELGEWLRAFAPGVARVRATPRTPWQNVVAAVSRLKQAGCETIGFDTGPRPDADLRNR
jgi:biopolymer transport protein ExbD